MLDSKLKDQLKAYLKMLKSNVTIGLSLNEDENSKKLKSFVEDVESLSDKIKIKEEKLDFTPAFSLNGEFEHGKIVFAGIPLGHEFESFVLALLQVGGIEPKISTEEKERIKSIKEKRNFETIVSLSCHNCPEVVQAFNIMAVLNKNISHTMIEGSINQDICEQRDVMAVPAIFENGASWPDFAHNFLFVYLGNLLGGSIFVAGFYSLGYRRQAREQEELKIKNK